MTEALSPEDHFRLQVLLAQDLLAVRIDESESSPALYALTDRGEARIPLFPNTRLDKYLRHLRELLSGHALGSPGGYPVFLTRWTRHGQMEGLNLGRLLLTGEPEAVVAVVHSPGLSDELARYAWWAMPSIENARLMLSREAVARGSMGPVLANYLVEHLPFLQDEHLDIMDTVVVLLYSGALSDEQRAAIWRRGKRVNTHYVGFLEVAGWDKPQPLPLPLPARTTASMVAEEAAVLARAFAAQGQTFLFAAAEILEHPETQDVVNRTLDAIGRYFADGWQQPYEAPLLQAAARLARVGSAQVAPIFARSSAIGSLMRRKIEPVVAPILEDIRTLLKG